MLINRYLVVSHPRDGERLPVHELLSRYHWHRLDEEHVLVNASFVVHNHEKLREHPDVSMLPSLSSLNPLSVHVGHGQRKQALLALPEIDPQSNMAHLVETIANTMGPLMQPRT